MAIILTPYNGKKVEVYVTLVLLLGCEVQGAVVCHDYADYEIILDAMVHDLLRGVVRTAVLCPMGHRCPFTRAHGWSALESSKAHVEVFGLAGDEVIPISYEVVWNVDNVLDTFDALPES